MNYQLIDGMGQTVKLRFFIYRSKIEIAIAIINQLLQLIENQ